MASATNINPNSILVTTAVALGLRPSMTFEQRMMALSDRFDYVTPAALAEALYCANLPPMTSSTRSKIAALISTMASSPRSKPMRTVFALLVLAAALSYLTAAAHLVVLLADLPAKTSAIAFAQELRAQ